MELHTKSDGSEPVEGQIVKQEEIVPRDTDVRLGSLAINNPRELVTRATELANALAEIIHGQKLFVVIQGKKYVMCEGWTTLGALIGVTPVEDYCRKLPDNKGYEARINLIRSRDVAIIGGASAECTYDEKTWATRDSHSLRSMALTRATGKAYRLAFSWIMKLAGFQPTPAEEMFQQEGSQAEADAVAQRKIAEADARKGGNQSQEPAKPKNGPLSATMLPSVFISWPPEQDGKFAFVTGLTAIKNMNLKPYIEREAKGIWSAPDSGWIVPGSRVDELKQALTELKCPFVEKS